MRQRRIMRAAAAFAGAALALAAPAGGQTPSTVDTAPLAPPPGAPAAPASPAAPAPPVPAAPATPAANPDRTLADKPGDPSDVDDLTLTARPALGLSGSTSWERGLEDLKAAQGRLAAEARRLGLAIAGRPVTLFRETDDAGFRFDALLPVERPPGPDVALDSGIRTLSTPAGRVLRFVHRGAYEDIDATYEGITAYLDAKGVTVQDQFAEEFVVTPKEPADPDAEINIYVLPR